MMNLKDLERTCRGLILSYTQGIRLEKLRKIARNFSQDNRYLSRDLNPGHPEYKPLDHDVRLQILKYLKCT
jgi:hypothetical protein